MNERYCTRRRITATRWWNSCWWSWRPTSRRKGKHGETALHRTTDNEHEAVVRLLVEQRANVKAKDEHFADANAVDEEDETPL
jgi:ankyrin repeat protein